MKLLFVRASFLLVSLVLPCCAFGQQTIEQVIYLIPSGYMGNVYIFHNVPDGVPLKREEGGALVYEIPKDGVLRSQSPEITEVYVPQYFYVTPDGTRERITGFWPSTIHDTPENRADKTIGIFFPRTGSVSGVSVPKGGGPAVQKFSCKIRYEQFYVGTKAYLLSTPDLEKDLFAYVEEHPICK
jgi:hypothetical protein